MKIRNEDDSLPIVELCSMKDKQSRKELWILSRNEDGSYLYRDGASGTESNEAGWTERFTEVWAMQCAIDFEPHPKTNENSIESFEENSLFSFSSEEILDLTSLNATSPLTHLPVTMFGYR